MEPALIPCVKWSKKGYASQYSTKIKFDEHQAETINTGNFYLFNNHTLIK